MDDGAPSADLTRRAFLQRAGLLGAAAALSAAGPAPAAWAAKGRRSKVRDIYQGKRGTTLWLDLEHGPYPHRAYPQWTDPTTLVFVPRHFRVHKDMQVDTLLHFHGHRDTAEEAMKRHQLREQLFDSLQNAILVVPQGPVRAESSRFGKLDERRGLLRFLGEVRKTLQTTRLQVALGPTALPRRARIGKLVVSAHSGGFRPAAMAVMHGGYNINEVWLFDALYGYGNAFRDWIVAARQHRGVDRHKLVSYYSGETLIETNVALMRMLDHARIPYLHETREGQLSRKEITAARAVFIRSATSHQGMLFRNNAMRDCLYASCFDRYLKTKWFKREDGPRSLEQRPGKRG
jgi:hypothetical protein